LNVAALVQAARLLINAVSSLLLAGKKKLWQAANREAFESALVNSSLSAFQHASVLIFKNLNADGPKSLGFDLCGNATVGDGCELRQTKWANYVAVVRTVASK
jgi:hypothetical protein